MARSLLQRTNLGYRLLLRREGASGPTGKPAAKWHNAVLKTRVEVEESANQVRRLGLPLVENMLKNWDTFAALDCILANTSKDAAMR